ncbi:MAG: SCP2 domain-containing protein [Steroidobacteraceae bacterium]
MLTSTLENVLNRGLPRSPRAQQLCAELAGRRVAIEIVPALANGSYVLVESTGDALKLLVVTAGTVQGTAAGMLPPDAIISGGPLSLLALSGPAPEAVLQRGDVRIDGDAELAQKFRELALLLRPDLEEELSLVLGDVPAHQLGRFARAALGFTQKAAATTVRNVAEYLGHERRDLVPRTEAEQFLQGVDTLREDVDRLAARIDLLTRP